MSDSNTQSSSGITSDAAGPEFDFTQWTRDNELSTNTISALLDTGFDSIKSLSKLNSDRIDQIFTTDITPAQKLLLADAVGTLVPAVRASPTSERPRHHNIAENTQEAARVLDFSNFQQKLNDGEGLGVDDVLRIMAHVTPSSHSGSHVSGNMAAPIHVSQNGGPPTISTSSAVQNGMFHNLLASTVSKSCTFRDVRDYVTLLPGKDQNSADSLEVGSIQIKVKDAKVPLSKVSQTQFMEGSIRILLEMIRKDNISMSTVIEHLDYLVKIANFGQAFDWSSVVNYDHEHRQAVAKQTCTWGSDNAFLMQLLLRQKQHMDKYVTPKTNAPLSSNTSRNRYDPVSAKPICERFNGRNGCSLRVCNYAHLCKSCYTPNHGDFNHPRSNGTQMKPKQASTDSDSKK